MEKNRLITFVIDQEIVQASQGQTTLESLLDADFPIDHSCGGNGTCGTCRVFVLEKLESLEPRNEIEAEMAQERGFTVNERLSCQMNPVSGLKLQRPWTKKGLE